MPFKKVEEQIAEKDARVDLVRRELAVSLRRLPPGPEANRARELLNSPRRLKAIPLAQFGVEEMPDDARLRGSPPVEMAELRHRLQQIEARSGKPRARAETIRQYLIAEGVILPRITRREGDGLLWVRFLMDGEPPETALQHVAELTARKRDTVHRNVSRFFAELGIEPPVALPQPARSG